MTGLCDLDATSQAAAVRDGQVSALELVDAAIERAERINPAINAIVHERFDRARDEARATTTGPFAGVPIVVKDLDGPMGGEPYHLGNRLLRSLKRTADHDSHLITKLRRAGFVVIGKTNCPELGLLPTTEPTAYGPTRNPWDRTRSPGGSSGGTAAAVAARVVALGHAGDGGGSIRIPASMCGLVGLKPTRGRVSLGPAEGEAWSGLVVRHVLTRTVRDSAAVLDVLAGPMPGDPYHLAPPARAFARTLDQPVGQLRIGLLTRAPGSLVAVDPACVAAAEATAAQLEALGHVVEESSPAALDDDDLVGHFLVIAATAVARELDRIATVAGRDLEPDDVERLTWFYAEMAEASSAGDLAAAIEGAHAWSRRVARWWDPADGGTGFDLLLTPTLAALPPEIGAVNGDHVDPGATLAGALPYGVFTVPWNVSGQPAISVPVASSDGLPVGAQLVGRTSREDLLLGVAGALEVALGWSDHRGPEWD